MEKERELPLYEIFKKSREKNVDNEDYKARWKAHEMSLIVKSLEDKVGMLTNKVQRHI